MLLVLGCTWCFFFFFSSRRRHTRLVSDWSSDVCSSDLGSFKAFGFLRVVGFLGLFIAFGHSILAMSGEETLAQVYREVEAPKLKNFKQIGRASCRERV